MIADRAGLKKVPWDGYLKRKCFLDTGIGYPLRGSKGLGQLGGAPSPLPHPLLAVRGDIQYRDPNSSALSEILPSEPEAFRTKAADLCRVSIMVVGRKINGYLLALFIPLPKIYCECLLSNYFCILV